ncbi:DMT family transporter [Candidatus Pacearchaeota archaeon]|nr:DMT family transporter [Candidatus Pacearchaeota archaeon]
MIIEIGVLAAFLAMLCWGIGDFLIQKNVRKIGDIEALAFIGIIGAIGIIPFVFNDILLLFSYRNAAILFLLGIITFVAAVFNFQALKEGKLAVVDVIIELELPVTIVLGFLFFKETLSAIQFSVIGFAFIGILMMAIKDPYLENPFKRLEKGVVLAVFAAVGMGLINFLTAASSKQISPLMAVWVPWVIFSFICLIVIGRREGFDKFIKNGIKFKWLVLGMAVFDTLAWIFYALATHDNEISIITAITESYPAIALFLGLWINKERIRIHQYFGAVLALISSFILAFILG